MKTFLRLAALTFLLGFCSPSALQAQDIKEGMPDEKTEPATENPAEIPPMPERRHAPPDIPMAAFGIAHPECLIWNNSCQTCARDDQDRTFCSTPGIACLAADISCSKNR